MLTAAERAAGRRFRDACVAQWDAEQTADPATWTVPPFIAVYRHLCAARSQVSTVIGLKEIYTYSPATSDVPVGRFGWLYRTGRCRHCSATVRGTGRLVDAHARTPLHGALVRQTPPLDEGER